MKVVSIEGLEKIINTVSLDAGNEIYSILENIEEYGVIEGYRLILEVIVKNILKQ